MPEKISPTDIAGFERASNPIGSDFGVPVPTAFDGSTPGGPTEANSLPNSTPDEGNVTGESRAALSESEGKISVGVNDASPKNPISALQQSLVEAEVIEALRTVYDPELPVNIYDLGLIYDITISGEKDVDILMTLTSPMCPVAGILPGEVASAVRSIPDIGTVNVELTWDPPYTLERMPDEVKLQLGFF